MKTFPLLGNNLREELLEPNKIPPNLDWLGTFGYIWNLFKTQANDYVIFHRFSTFPGPSQVEIPLAAAPWVAGRIRALLLPPEQGGEPLDVFTAGQTVNKEELVVFRCTVFGKQAGFRLYNKTRKFYDNPPPNLSN